MTDEAKALVERLRNLICHGNLTCDTLGDCDEAADRIEELDRHLTLSGKVSKALSERIEALEAENKRLREALDNIANESSDTWAREKARAALEGDSHDQ